MAGVEKLAIAQGGVLLRIDCRSVEPTAAGFLHGLCTLLGRTLDDHGAAADALSMLGDRVVVVFDNYEVFRLADSWLRREFIPSLDVSVRILLISRESPGAGWISAREWRDHFDTISVSPSADQNPIRLARQQLDAIKDPALQSAFDAFSVVRRITRPLLASLCPEDDSAKLYEAIGNLGFVEVGRDGLAMHEAVHQDISTRLQAADPQRYRAYQRRAWGVLRRQLAESTRADLWRTTADVIFLIENPVIREAFFPSESARFSVEPAMPGDECNILEITRQHDADALEDMALWWARLPSAFHVIKDSSGVFVGFYCAARPDELDAEWMRFDPVARNWLKHLRQKGEAARVPALFLRRWLSQDDGESPGPVQAAAWIDVKRTYLELRPELRRVYLTLGDLGPYGPVATELGFTVLTDLEVTSGDTTYHSAMLDFGPGSVDGWIFNLVAAELGITDEQLLDPGARELVVNGSRIALTPLEYGVVAMLESRTGEAVSRDDLLRSVWGHGYDGGSNVVDAVVGGLRRKLGAHASMLETVRGIGYRLQI